MKSTSGLSFSNIITNRLVLRKLKISDASAIFALQSNEQNRKYIDRLLMTELAEAEHLIKKLNTGIDDNQWLYWGICLKEDMEVIGTICIWQFSDDEPYKAEVGYELLPECQGRGIMNEALHSIVDYGFNVIKLDYLEACTAKNNTGSIRLLEKNKFSFAKTLPVEEKTEQEKALNFLIYSRKNTYTQA